MDFNEFNNFDSIQIGLASAEKIREWSHGEVKKPETINYRTLKPEKDGLFCERIFGPQKDGECHCGKYKKNKYKGIVCDKCGVEVTNSKVRRIRMGHIELAAPVSHIWFFKGVPCRMSLVLGINPKPLEKVLYFASYVVLDPGETNLTYKQVLSETDYQKAVAEYGPKSFVAKMGAEAIQTLLQELDLDALSAEIRAEIDALTKTEKEKGGQTIANKKAQLVKRLEVVEAFRLSHNKPEWMVLDVLPVIPPDLRPMVQLDGGRFATSDLNDLYRRVINRNNRLKKLKELHAPDIIVRNEKRMLQEAVDALFDNSRRSHPVTGPGSRPLRSLSDMLKGKQGRFRQNLLGKRVDYSGRSVIVVGPELKIYQCGLPKEMALELFKPFVMKKLVTDQTAQNIKSARKKVERAEPEVWSVLEEIIKEHPVLLNRAPTLHRLGIQAFEPVLVEGRALKLHPLVCTAYNADFDGDQMAVHVPLSVEAQSEARFLMLSANNLLAPKDGKPITVPTQDMVLGSYYLTLLKEKDYSKARIYKNEDEAKAAFDLGVITLHTPLIVGREAMFEGQMISGSIKTTMGKLIFNQAIPQDLGFVDRTDINKVFDLEINTLVKKKTLEQIIDKCIKKHGLTKTAVVLDNIKAQGYKYSTRGAITVGVADIIVPNVKDQLIADADKAVDAYRNEYRRGRCSEEERYRCTIEVWKKTIDELTEILKANMGEFNNIYMMSDSGARGNINQIKQLAGMRGLMSDTSGKTIEIPIKANFREGLDVLEFFISSHGTRKTLSDTALRTADSGYLTRRLVDVSHEVIIREFDCGTDDGISVAEIVNEETASKDVVVPLEDRIVGRYLAEDVIDPATGELIVGKNELVYEDSAKKIATAGIKQVRIRSVLTCGCRYGVCAKCYGTNLASNSPCNIGEVVGIIAAQSIGEPGTQLTMRTFHTGGVATADDITQGLPRVEELFEARKPKGLAVIAEISGKVSIEEKGKKNEITIISDEGETWSCIISASMELKVEEGQYVEKGSPIVGAAINPNDMLRVRGVDGVQKYIIEEVQRVYNSQGVKINDRHLEVIVRQMLRKVKVNDPGETNLLPGGVVDLFTFADANSKAAAEGKHEATGSRILLGITKASLATESFLSAASFQETTKVLSDAAIKCKTDMLLGLKENVIIGKLIPAGTGMSRYKDIDINVEPITGAEAVEPVAEVSAEETKVEEESFAAEEIEVNEEVAVENADDGFIEE
ncbi:MAG: DNA-directed RNA polymerase subunit beta' [Clostridia bacterium]|nr:DNA-directed RNA polymerase subunit beta' [Clostridia bacterium]